jgi:prephenate dehydrogenase
VSSVGIVGYGSFGALLARLIAPYAVVRVYDHQSITTALPDNVTEANIKEVANCQVVIISTDLMNIASVCDALAPLVTPQTIVMDVCSVKIRPAEILAEKLGNRCRLLLTHPMFGPQSVTENGSLSRDDVIIWYELSGGPFTELEQLFATKLGLTICTMTPEEHDRQMAYIHGLTFFVTRGLVNMNIPELSLRTGYYKKLRALIALEETHSPAIFKTVEAGNPYVAAVRRQYITALQSLDASILDVAS